MEAVLYLPLLGRGAWPLLGALRGSARPEGFTQTKMVHNVSGKYKKINLLHA